MEGWKEVTLGSICIVKKGEQYNKLNLENQGDYPCINGGISPSGYTDKWNTDKNTITISEGGNSCGYINLIPTKFWSGGHCYSILEIKEHLNYEFLYHALKSREKRIMDLRVGSGIPNIQQKAIKTFKIKFPESIPEQQKIAEILSSIDTAIGETEALIAKYERIKTGLMQDLLTKGIDANGNIRNENTHEFKDSPLGRVPVEWEVKKFENVAFPIDAQPDHRTPKEASDGVPYIGINDIDEYGEVKVSCRKVVIEAYLKQKERFTINEGDIVFGKIGTIGFPKKLKQNSQIAISANVILLKPLINPTFVYWLLETKYVMQQVTVVAHSTSQAAFGMEKVRKILVKLPNNTAEQDRIAIILDNQQKSIEQEKKYLNKLKLQKNALMQDLLTGKVRVNNLLEA